MKNAHIAFVSYPQYPHVGPTLPIVSVLVRRGYRVTYVTSEQFAQRVAALGADVISCPRVPAFAIVPNCGESATESFMESLSSLTARTLDAITPFYAQDQPDLFIYDPLALAGRVLVERWKLPAVRTSPVFALNKDALSQQVANEPFRQLILRFSKQVDELLERSGVQSARDWMFHRERLNIYLFPRAFQPLIESNSSTCVYAGRCPGEQPYFGSWRRDAAAGRPIALVSTSTLYVRGPDFFRMCIQALSPLGFHVVLSVGDAVDPAALSPLPPHFEIIQGVSHVKILPYVSVFVCLGGIITSAEAAYHGIPLVVTTHGFPELEWQAENLVRLGLAIHLKDAETNVESVRSAAARALEDNVMHDRARILQHVVRREPGGEEVANAIEDHLHAR